MISSAPGDVCVVGGGVAGLAVALHLQRAGRRVCVLDPLPPGSETSSGNAGLLSPDTVTPIGMPGLVRQLPRMLLNGDGPLRLRARGLPRALPWLARWLAATRPKEVERVSDAMRSLHRNAFADWHELLGVSRFDELVREHGQLRVWEGNGGPSGDEIRLQDRHGIHVEPVGGRRLRMLAPGLAPSFRRGLLVAGNGYTIDPRSLVIGLAERLASRGGELRQERVVALLPLPGTSSWRLMTTSENRTASCVVVAAGLWSRELLRPLGINLPLESERGYHVSMPGVQLEMPQPVIFAQAGFVVTQMRGGLRAAGTVEIGAHPSPPDYGRAERLLAQAVRVFPALRPSKVHLWSGDRPSTPDGLPLLGAVRGRPGLFLCTGHGHFGLTGAPRSGEIVARAIQAGALPCAGDARYTLDRFTRNAYVESTPPVVQKPLVKELP